MRGNGITYDKGFVNQGVSTHEPFDPKLVEREMGIIHDDLHCNAVRVTGGDVARLDIAATHAAAAGLEVWFCPFTCDLTVDELLMLIDDCAQRAQRLLETSRPFASEILTEFLNTIPASRLMQRWRWITAGSQFPEAVSFFCDSLADRRATE